MGRIAGGGGGGGTGALGSVAAGGQGQSIVRQESLTWKGKGADKTGGGGYECDQDGCRPLVGHGRSKADGGGGGGGGGKYECDESGCHVTVRATQEFVSFFLCSLVLRERVR